MLFLADTSVWVEHLRRGLRDLADCLQRSEIVTHPFVIGELACGNLSQRRNILHLLALLPQVKKAHDGEALAFIEARRLAGCGLGWIDVHLLASTVLSGVKLWTLDKALARSAERLGVSYRSAG